MLGAPFGFCGSVGLHSVTLGPVPAFLGRDGLVGMQGRVGWMFLG